MTASKRRWLAFSARTMFAITLIGGLCQVFVALAIVPVRPVFQLDAVLSPDELKDQAIKDKTREMLERAAGNEWLFWLAPGLLISSASLAGLYVTRTEKPAPQI
jgi:hypothetical protein